VWGSEFTTQAANLQEGLIVVLRPLFAAALVVRRRYLIMVPRLLPAAYLIVVPGRCPRRHAFTWSCIQAAARGAARCALHAHCRSARTDACGRSFAVLSTLVSADGFRLRLVVPRPMPAAVASRFCPRKFQQSVCACGTIGDVWQHA
jgi:hypothetical protein